MRAKPMVLIVIAAVCGLVASIGISQVMDANAVHGVVETPMEKIYLALNEIEPGTKLDEKHVRLESWPKDKVPQGAITKLEELKDKYPITRFFKDDPIRAQKLSDRMGGVIDKIPEGYRVVPVKVSVSDGVGLITPGDSVDVLVFMRKSPDVPITTTKTVLTNVRVFAVGVETERSVDKDGKSVAAQTISLLVTPKQVQKVLMAVELGRIQLSLRSGKDKNAQEDPNDEGTSLSDWFQDDSQTGKPTTTAASTSPTITTTTPNVAPGPTVPVITQTAKVKGGAEFSDWLQQLQQSVKPTALPSETAPAPKYWTMQIVTPDGTKTIQWDNSEDAPQEVSQGTPGTKTVTAPRQPTDPRSFVGTNVEITGRTIQNNDLNWSKYRGKPVVVAFWATWCPACRGETPLLKTLQEGYADQGLQIVTVNFDKDPTSASKYLVENQLSWETIFGADSEQLATKLGVQSIPTVLLFDGEGRLNAVTHHVGEMLPQVSLIYGSAPKGIDLRAFLPVDNTTKKPVDEAAQSTSKEEGKKKADTETADEATSDAKTSLGVPNE